MIQLYFSEVSSSPEIIRSVEAFFSEKVVSRMKESGSELYKNRRYASKYMLIKIFERLQINPNELKKIYYGANGKMIYPNDRYKISISYSDQLAACLISESEVSLDVERIKKEVKKNTIEVLNGITGNKITNPISFYRKWTELEAITKMYESRNLSDVAFHYEKYSKGIRIRHLFYKNQFLIAIASRKRVKKIEIITI